MITRPGNRVHVRNSPVLGVGVIGQQPNLWPPARHITRKLDVVACENLDCACRYSGALAHTQDSILNGRAGERLLDFRTSDLGAALDVVPYQRGNTLPKVREQRL